MTATHSNKPPNNGLKPGITSSKSTHMLCSPCSKIKMHGDKPYLQSGAKTEHAQHCPDPELYMVSTPAPAALQARVLWPAELVLHRGVGSPIPGCHLMRRGIMERQTQQHGGLQEPDCRLRCVLLLLSKTCLPTQALQRREGPRCSSIGACMWYPACSGRCRETGHRRLLSSGRGTAGRMAMLQTQHLALISCLPEGLQDCCLDFPLQCTRTSFLCIGLGAAESAGN